MTAPIALYYDFVSPYSYFAFAQRDQIQARTGRSLSLRPVHVGRVMEVVGNVPTSITCKAKRAYLGQDIARWARMLKLPVRPHPAFGRFSTEPLIKAALLAGDDVEAFSAAAFTAVWEEAAPIDDAAAMTNWFEARDPRFARYWAGRDTMAAALDQRVEQAVADGAFGVPYFHTDIGAFFGNDRVDFLVEALTA